MTAMKLGIKALSDKLGKEIPYPYYASAGAAAMDLHACLDEPMRIPAHGRAFIPTGFSIALPERGYAAFIFARSGLAARRGLCLANGVGVIDSDYRGEVTVSVYNASEEEAVIQPGERIAQMAVMPVIQAELELREELDETVRGSGGFGSTGAFSERG